MNLHNLIDSTEKPVIAKNILKDRGAATLLKLKKDGVLKEHQSMTNAMLVLLSGSAVYDEAERSEKLVAAHDFVNIPAKVTHKVTAIEDSLLLLIQ